MDPITRIPGVVRAVEEVRSSKMSKLPIPPTIKHQKKDGSKRTIITNFGKIAHALRSNPDLIRKYISYELNEPCLVTKDRRLLAIPGRYDIEFISANFEGFMDLFVLCGSCRSSSTVIEEDEFKNRKFLSLYCDDCRTRNRIHHRLAYDVVVKSPELSTDSSESSTPTSASPDLVKEEDDKFVMAAQQLERMLETNGEITDSEIIDFAYKLMAQARLPVPDLVPLIWLATIGSSSNMRLAVDIYASLFLLITEAIIPFDSSLLILGCIESSFALVLEGNSTTVSDLVTSLVNNRVLDVDTIIGWYEGTIQPVFRSGISLPDESRAKVRQSCASMVQNYRDGQLQDVQTQNVINTITGGLVIDEPGYVNIYDKRKPTVVLESVASDKMSKRSRRKWEILEPQNDEEEESEWVVIEPSQKL